MCIQTAFAIASPLTDIRSGLNRQHFIEDVHVKSLFLAGRCSKQALFQASAVLVQNPVCKNPRMSVSPALLGASLVALVPKLPVVVRMPCAGGCCAGSVSPAAPVRDSADHQLLNARAKLALVSARCLIADGHKIPCSMLLLIMAGQTPGRRSFLSFFAGMCIDQCRVASGYPHGTPTC